MQLRNVFVAAVFVASAGLMSVGCGEEGGGETACTDNSQCGSDQICHPFAKVCVTKCTSGSDCPSTAKTCGTIDVNGTPSESFCQCATDALCGGGTGSSTVCSDSQDRICTVKCADDSACGAGRVCNEKGHCVNGTTTGGACDPSQPQPDGCSNGQMCNGTGTAGTCGALPAATCQNFSAHGTTWTPASPGAVIYELSKDSVTDVASGGFCGTAATRFKVHVKAYWKTGTFPTADTDFQNLYHVVDTNGNELTGSSKPGVQTLTVTNGGKNADFFINFCRPTGSTTLSVGMHFVDGNETCSQINR